MRHCAVNNNIEVRLKIRVGGRRMFSIIHIYFCQIHFFPQHFHLALPVSHHLTPYKEKGLISDRSQSETLLWSSGNETRSRVRSIFSGCLSQFVWEVKMWNTVLLSFNKYSLS